VAPFPETVPYFCVSVQGFTPDAVSIRDLNGWPLWIDLAKFCEKAPEPMEAFTVDLDFGRLDA
jgi:hypothetical protein